MKFRNALLTASLLACVAPAAMAQSTGDVNITGTIVPGPCDVTIAGGGIADFGTVDSATLSPTLETQLTTVPKLTLSISCSSPTLIAMTAFDNRSGTLSASQQSVAEWFSFGLTSKGNPIGAYRIWTDDPELAGVASNTIESINATTWTDADWGWHRENNAVSPEKYRAFGSAAGGPVPVTTATWELAIEAHINPKNDLALTQDTPMDGSATLQINYL